MDKKPVAIRYNTDRFTDDMKAEITRFLKSENNEVTVRGPAYQEFVEWIQKEIPNAVKNKDGYYTTRKIEEDHAETWFLFGGN